MKVVVFFNGHVVYDVEDLTTIIKGITVDEKGYGSTAKYMPDGRNMMFSLIRDDQLVTEEKESIAMLREAIKNKDEYSNAQRSKAYKAEQENAELKKKIEILEKLCPHTAEEERKEDQQSKGS